MRRLNRRAAVSTSPNSAGSGSADRGRLPLHAGDATPSALPRSAPDLGRGTITRPRAARVWRGPGRSRGDAEPPAMVAQHPGDTRGPRGRDPSSARRRNMRTASTAASGSGIASPRPASTSTSGERAARTAPHRGRPARPRPRCARPVSARVSSPVPAREINHHIAAGWQQPIHGRRRWPTQPVVVTGDGAEGHGAFWAGGHQVTLTRVATGADTRLGSWQALRRAAGTHGAGGRASDLDAAADPVLIEHTLRREAASMSTTS